MARASAVVLVVVVATLAWVACCAQASHGREGATTVPTIFIVPHSHDDTGWLRTVDEYHNEWVRYILDGVVHELSLNRNRTFVQVETAFFQRWWTQQPDSVKAQVKQLVANGQLEFINGGWCMADEADVDYEGVVNQLTLGHKFLLEELGVRPRVAWHIDPFGASATYPAMFADMGFDAFIINRIHYELKTAWQASKGLEFTWRGTPSRNNTADMFTHVLDSHYSAPWGFDFEYIQASPSVDPFSNAVTNPPLRATNTSFMYPANIEDRATDFAAQMLLRASYFRTPNVLVPFGDDFKFVNAKVEYENMDLLMNHINANVAKYGIRMRYSTAGQYIDAVQATKTEWPVYTGDFFPYAFAPDGARFDQPGWASADSYWAGFYTSRPQLKGYCRSYDAVLRATELVHAVAANTHHAAPALQSATKVLHSGAVPGANPLIGLQQMREVSGVLKHHDAETGTSVPAVVEDFIMRATLAGAVGEVMTAQAVAGLASSSSAASAAEVDKHAAGGPVGRFHASPAALRAVCDGAVTPVLLYNPLAHARREVLQLPLECANVAVTARNGSAMVAVPAQVNLNQTMIVEPIPPDPQAAFAPTPPPPPAASKYNLFVLVDLPPAGFTTIFLTGNATAATPGVAAQGKVSNVKPSNAGSITNGVMTLSFDAKSGNLATMKVGSEEVVVDQEFLVYESMTSWPDSTAYILRPTDSEKAYSVLQNTTMSAPTMVRINGPLVNEMVQTYNPRPRHNSSQAWVQQSLRLYSDPAPAASPDALDVRTYVDVGIIAGMTLPNRELITRFSTSLDNSVPPDTDSSSATATPSQQQPKQPGSATVSPSVAAAMSAAAAQQQARQQEQEQRRVNLAARSLSANDDFPDARFVFYTDANGVGIKRREKNHPYFEKYIENPFWAEPVAVNYYPAPTASFIRDELDMRRLQLTVVTDRAHGIGCLGQGQLEMMIHRRNSVTGTPSLDDTSVISTRQFLSLATWPSNASLAHRVLSRRLIHPVVPVVDDAMFDAAPSQELATAWSASHVNEMTFVAGSLPRQVALQSFDVMLENTTVILLRLRHMFATGEHPVLSKPVNVDLTRILNPELLTITSVQPVTLNANANIGAAATVARGSALMVELKPLETKTYKVVVQPTKGAARSRR